MSEQQKLQFKLQVGEFRVNFFFSSLPCSKDSIIHETALLQHWCRHKTAETEHLYLFPEGPGVGFILSRVWEESCYFSPPPFSCCFAACSSFFLWKCVAQLGITLREICVAREIRKSGSLDQENLKEILGRSECDPLTL